MDNIIILPSRDDLAHVFSQIPQDDPKRKEIFSELGKRVIEHSDEVKRMHGLLDGEFDGNEETD